MEYLTSNLPFYSIFSPEVVVREVWYDNLESELYLLNHTARQFPCISVKMEFPGIVRLPDNLLAQSPVRYSYLKLRMNINKYSILQLGLTLFNERGETAGPLLTTWLFHFTFNFFQNPFNFATCMMLKTDGMNFREQRFKGIKHSIFGPAFANSGLICNNQIKWFCYQGVYDFGALVSLLTFCKLPAYQDTFNKLLTHYFPIVFDVKYVVYHMIIFTETLEELAQQFLIPRYNNGKKTAYDSHLLAQTFYKLLLLGVIDPFFLELRARGVLYGLGLTSHLLPNIYAPIPTCSITMGIDCSCSIEILLN